MKLENMEEIEVLSIILNIIKPNCKKIWIDYEKENNMRHINFTYLASVVEHEENNKIYHLAAQSFVDELFLCRFVEQEGGNLDEKNCMLKI